MGREAARTLVCINGMRHTAADTSNALKTHPALLREAYFGDATLLSCRQCKGRELTMYTVWKFYWEWIIQAGLCQPRPKALGLRIWTVTRCILLTVSSWLSLLGIKAFTEHRLPGMHGISVKFSPQIANAIVEHATHIAVGRGTLSEGVPFD